VTSPLKKLSSAGLRVHLGASVTSSHIDSEQPRFRIEGVRGSYEKRGVDPQENQLKKGWLPIDKPNQFGFYEDEETDSLKFGRITTTVKEGNPEGPTQPLLKSNDIPTLNGNYLAFYQNIARSILVSKDEVKKNGEEAAKIEIEKVQAVKMVETEMVTKVIEMAWESQEKGRRVMWDE